MAYNKERIVKGGKHYEVFHPLHEIDSFNGEELRKHITSSDEQCDIVIIDFSEVVYLNSSGLRELIQIMKFTMEHNSILYLAQLSEDIMKIFIHTNLDRLFVFYETLAEALDAAN